jgi:hypothetical protein
MVHCSLCSVLLLTRVHSTIWGIGCHFGHRPGISISFPLTVSRVWRIPSRWNTKHHGLSPFVFRGQIDFSELVKGWAVGREVGRLISSAVNVIQPKEHTLIDQKHTGLPSPLRADSTVQCKGQTLWSNNIIFLTVYCHTKMCLKNCISQYMVLYTQWHIETTYSHLFISYSFCPCSHMLHYLKRNDNSTLLCLFVKNCRELLVVLFKVIAVVV